jgi:hypothetical protein
MQTGLLGAVICFLCLAIAPRDWAQRAVSPRKDSHRNVAKPVVAKSSEYAGSKACAGCHQGIYESYKKTDMGRSMVMPQALAAEVPRSAAVFDAKSNRHFEISDRQGELYQSEFEVAPDGTEVFRETHKVEWIIGSGANGLGALVQRGSYLFEGPLSFYANAGKWDLSPGYEYGDYGFSRPILPGCIACHSGRARAVPEGNGRFEEPPFEELAIGCENCHGPGAQHVFEQQLAGPTVGAKQSIVSPSKLSPWLADNICMACHQTGEARVLHAGKQYSDFRAGAPLDETLSIFVVPFDKKAPPQDDLLEHYLSMRLSRCYEGSKGQLSCVTCHDPHVEPAAEEAPSYFRNRCLTCHTMQSCTADASARAHSTPADNCIDCHMPRRSLKTISHSMLTNHRILARPGEPFPDMAYKMTTAALPDLIHLSAAPGTTRPADPLILLQAYRQVMLTHPEYRPRYWELGKQLAGTHPKSVPVLQALTDAALQSKDAAAPQTATRYLEKAIALGSKEPADFQLLASLYLKMGRKANAEEILKQGMEQNPYDANLYRAAIGAFLSSQKTQQACGAAAKAMGNFPQDARFRELVKQCTAAMPR